jgi:hypothetical protein
MKLCQAASVILSHPVHRDSAFMWYTNFQCMNQVEMKATIGNVFVFNKIENIHSFQLKLRSTIHSPKHENSSQMEILWSDFTQSLLDVQFPLFWLPNKWLPANCMEGRCTWKIATAHCRYCWATSWLGVHDMPWEIATRWTGKFCHISYRWI